MDASAGLSVEKKHASDVVMMDAGVGVNEDPFSRFVFRRCNK